MLHRCIPLNPQSIFTALTPWIALVSCDKNATDASQEIDIFTLARDKGAVAAVCIPPDYFPSYRP